MFVKGSHQVDNLVESIPNYPLKGKADVVFQNTGETTVQVGSRKIEPDDSYRMCGELTILQNDNVSVKFENVEDLTNSVFVHYIMPEIDNCN